MHSLVHMSVVLFLALSFMVFGPVTNRGSVDWCFGHMVCWSIFAIAGCGQRVASNPHVFFQAQDHCFVRVLAMADPRSRSPPPLRRQLLHLDSDLAGYLLEEWAWGKISAAELQRLSSHALSDQHRLLSSLKLSNDFASKSLAKFASLGDSGKYEGNVKRDLLRYLGDPALPEPEFTVVPMARLKASGDEDTSVVLQSFPIYEPHVLFAWMYHHMRRRFVDLFLGGDPAGGGLRKFWQHVRATKDPRLEGHDTKSRGDWDRLAVPASIHGDAVPCTSVGKAGTKSFNIYSFAGLLGKGSTLLQKHYIFGNFTCNEVDTEEHDFGHAVWVRVLWSLWFLYLGIWPTTDPQGKPYSRGSDEAKKAGTPLADGFFLSIWSIKADLDHLTKAFGLEHYCSKKPCTLCPASADASAPPLHWYNCFRDDAWWMDKAYSHRQWNELMPNPFFLFQLEYLSAANIDPDELHVMHLGTSMYMLGSILMLLCYHVLPKRPQANMREVWQKLASYYKDGKVVCQFGNLTTNSFVTDTSAPHKHYPKLKGKGAEVRDLVWPMLEVWKQLGRGHAQYDRICQLLQHQVHMQSILHDNAEEVFLPKKDVHAFQREVCNFLKTYSLLANWADRSKLFVFSVTIKFHYMYHMGLRAEHLNPRLGCTMIDEDFVGRCKHVVAACANATEAHVVPEKFAERYIWGKYIVLSSA